MSNSTPQINGDVPHSAMIDHLLGYPVINDSVDAVKRNPLGQRTIEIGDSAYKTLTQSMMPYLSRPLQYVSPYVKKVDDLGDKTLSTIDEKFPYIKKPTGDMVNDAKTIAFFPLRIGQTGKEHVVNTYSSEYKKVGNDNLIAYGKAMLSTALILSTELLTTASNYLGNKKIDAKSAVEERTSSN